MYAQDRAPGRRPLNISPHDSQALEQVRFTDINHACANHFHQPASEQCHAYCCILLCQSSKVKQQWFNHKLHAHRTVMSS